MNPLIVFSLALMLFITITMVCLKDVTVIVLSDSCADYGSNHVACVELTKETQLELISTINSIKQIQD